MFISENIIIFLLGTARVFLWNKFMSFSWINQQRLILLIMIRYLILLAPGLV